MKSESRLPASFRDPSGFVFRRDGVLYRQVNRSYREEYERLMASGLYEKLVAKGWLIPHREVALDPDEPGSAYKIIRPEPVPFISYPYEWSFSMLRDAALATLRIAKQALEHGLSLKDASAYNIQFINGKPALIDTLSFETYQEDQPWVAYRQFCQHFLAPLALMAHQDIRLGKMLQTYIDGIPLDLAARLLPARSRFNLALATHIHLHAAAQKRYAGSSVQKEKAPGKSHMPRTAFLGLLDSLQSTVKKMDWKPAGTEWAAYYEETNYTPAAVEHKKELVSQYLERACPGSVWDLGANTGLFSRLASQQNISTVAFDVDPAAVELNYRALREKKETNLLPLVMDLTNPSPAIGWHNQERESFMERGPVDALLALALIHHLAISNNVPLPQLADFFHAVTRWLIIEFIPKSDSQVRRLLSTREDIFPSYTVEGFEQGFGERFVIHQKEQVRESERILYLMEKRDT